MLEDLLEKWAPYFRWVQVLLLFFLLSADVFLYSLYQADHARLQTVHRKMERLELYLSNAIKAKKNDTKILSIEQQINGIEMNLDSLATALKDYKSNPVEDVPSIPKKRKSK